MVESVAELVGFEVAALSVVLGEELVTLAYTCLLYTSDAADE